MQSSQDLLDVLEQQLKIQKAKEGFAKIQAEYDLDVLQLNQEYRDSLADAKTEQEQLNLAKAQGLELDILLDQKRKDNLLLRKEFEAFMNNEKDLNTELTQTQELLKGAGDIIANQLTGGIEEAIRGTATWGDLLQQHPWSTRFDVHRCWHRRHWRRLAPLAPGSGLLECHLR